MNRGPVSGYAAKDHVSKVHSSWGDNAPEWVITLAERCNISSQSAVAAELAYSAALVSQILSNSYRGDVSRVEQMVRGRYMAATVVCPIAGEIGRDVCLGWQKKPFATTSSHRVSMYRACRAGCAHSSIKNQGEVNDA